MRRPLTKMLLALGVILMAATLTSTALAQTESKPKRLRAPTTVRGLVGGEANDTYVVHVRKGRLLTIQISWRSEGDNTASFGVGDSPTLEPVSFGTEYNGGRKWVGRVPKTKDYYVEVVAHPSAHYVLRISVK